VDGRSTTRTTTRDLPRDRRRRRLGERPLRRDGDVDGFFSPEPLPSTGFGDREVMATARPCSGTKC